MRGTDAIEIGLVNNMPDGAFDATEQQFRNLLHEASPGPGIELRLLSLSGVPRGSWGREHVSKRACNVRQIQGDPPDALIVTGTEPRAADLRREPYWDDLTWLFDWVEYNGVPVLLSCLAAHAVALHVDGIERKPLAHKRFGVFEHNIVMRDPLTDGLEPPVRFPHSRWNEVVASELTAKGWRVLTCASDGSVDTYTKRRRSHMLCLQGHPEYGPEILAKEYRRDIGRYLEGARDIYPEPPEGYFDEPTLKVLVDLQTDASRPGRSARDALSNLTCDGIAGNTWHINAVTLFRNWLLEACRMKQAAHCGSQQYA